MTTFPLPTMSCTVDETGIHAPPYADIFGNLQFLYRGIYGSDAYLEPDSQDGQWLAVLARAFSDANNMAIAVWNAFSPATARGVGLSSVVKINGLKRQDDSNSTVDIRCIGQAGATVMGGVVKDALGQQWKLRSFIFPPGGDVIVSATATAAGALRAAPNTINQIVNPTRGWQSATNPSSANPGQPIEVDAQLRARQSVSTANDAVSPTEAVQGSLLALPGVTAAVPYENDTNATDANGLPPHSLAMVVAGGDAFAIAQVIQEKKTQGGATFGTTTEVVPDYAGVPRTINFFRPTIVTIQVEVTLTPLSGYTTSIGAQIQQAVADYVNSLKIGDDVILTRLYVPANLSNAAAGETFDVTLIRVGKNGGSLGTADIVVAFDEDATCVVTDVTVIT